MRKPSHWVLKSILNQCAPDQKSALERYLSKEERTALATIEPPEWTLPSEERPLEDIVHWSWLLPALKSHTPEEQKLFLSALPQSIFYPLRDAVTMPPFEPEQLGAAAQKFLKTTLAKTLLDEQRTLLPIPFLPPSPLNRLAHLKKNELIRLIDFLALFDLALELKQIVDTKILKKIYRFLSAEEKLFLRTASKDITPFATTRLKFEDTDGSKESFRNLLHKRGLARLGAALSEQSSDLCWYIRHQLDIGRGTLLAKFYSVNTPQEIQEAIQHQVEIVLEHEAVQ